jgi:hypothetical protein
MGINDAIFFCEFPEVFFGGGGRGRGSRRTFDRLTLKLEKCLDVLNSYLLVPVAARCKAWGVCSRSPGEIPPGAWMSVCCECCALSVRGLCDELVTRS